LFEDEEYTLEESKADSPADTGFIQNSDSMIQDNDDFKRNNSELITLERIS